MNDPCPVCGLIIEREQGYFLGSMYVSYTLACLLIGVGYFIAEWFLPTWHEFALIGLVVVPYLLLAPLVVRYSRAVWIYVDRRLFSGDIATAR